MTQQLVNLEAVGPVMEVFVAPSRALTQALRSVGAAIPQPVKVTAMVDTGATGTVVTNRVIQALGLSPVGQASMQTPSTTQPVPVYRYQADIVLPNRVNISNVFVLAAPMQGQHIECLIGRDVLSLGVLVYIGYLNQFTMGF